MKIKNVEVGDLFLAPLAGVSDVGFRSVCRDCGATFSYTEMINCNALLHENKQTLALLNTEDNERPCAVQIFGHEPDSMAKVCASEYLEKFDVIDINFGCPAPKIVKNGDGSSLLLHIDQIAKIVSACVAATDKPITCKIRIGFYKDQNVAVEVAKACEASGASAICVHGRTREQMYSGTVDYDTIKKVKQSVSIPVIGNGDVFDKDSYDKMLQTGVDAVMIARGALGNPFLFSALKNKEITSKFECVKKHIEILRKNTTEKSLCLYMRKHFLWYVKDIRNAREYKVQLSRCEDVDEALEILKEIMD